MAGMSVNVQMVGYKFGAGGIVTNFIWVWPVKEIFLEVRVLNGS